MSKLRVRTSNPRNGMTAKALLSTTFWIVSMGGGMWFAPWEGDPGRTCSRSSAKLYRSKRKAQRAIEKATGLYPGRNASEWRAEKIVLSEGTHEAGDLNNRGRNSQRHPAQSAHRHRRPNQHLFHGQLHTGSGQSELEGGG